MPSRLWQNGPGVPLTTPFLSTEGNPVDHAALAKQVVRCAKAGLGIVLLGTTGEASHLSPAERKACVITARKALDDNGLQDAPLCVGTGGGSTPTTVELTKDAAEAGASHALVICPGYFAFSMRDDRASILAFFNGVMDKSPIPVMIYNFPGAASGIDLNSDEISILADHPQCFGVKLTCAMVGKGQRIAAYTQSSEYLAKKGGMLKSVTASGLFQVLPGLSESLLPVLVAKHTGCITGTGCLFPHTIRRLYDLSFAGLQGDASALAKAMTLQDRVARSDFIVVKASFAGSKYFLDTYVEKGLGGACRFPLGPANEKTKKMIDTDLKEDWEYECSLAGEAKA